jgi:S-adenosyl-L-methionine hydrolase (adenosine-forming)
LPPLIALLTDFGTRDWYVAAMKGVMKTICPEADLVDISHDVTPQSVVEAAFMLAAARASFPQGTIFLAVIDPGVGTSREPVLVRAFEQWFIAPNNGLLGLVLEKAESVQCRELTNGRYFQSAISRTFHGRDVFAPVAAHLANGVPALELAPRHIDLAGLPVSTAFQEDENVHGNIVYFDRFGNAITNIDQGVARELVNFECEALLADRGLVIPVLHTYGDVGRNQPLAYWGSLDLLEVGVNFGSARELLKLSLLQPVVLRRQSPTPGLTGPLMP